MNTISPDWLTQLAPAHAPPPPGWWPLALGWWVLLGLLIIAIAVFIFWQSRPPVRLRRIALRELRKLQTTVTEDIAFAQELENLMRRFAVVRYGRDTVANLSGDRWIEFVVKHGGASWSGDSGASLLRTAYGGAATVNRSDWLTGAQTFIRERS